jgi:FixJ family two-component response regulator
MTGIEESELPPAHGVFVVDDDVSVREALALLIRVAGWRPRVFASPSEFLACPRVRTPSCLILDVQLPELSGVDLLERISDRTELSVILITAHGDVPTAVRAMKAGAVEFLTKPFSDDMILGSIRAALGRSEQALSQESAKEELRQRYASLNHRERDVMRLVVLGRLNKRVGAELNLSEITVKAYRGRVMRKMAANSLADLIDMSARLGFTQLSVEDTQPPAARPTAAPGSRGITRR